MKQIKTLLNILIWVVVAAIVGAAVMTIANGSIELALVDMGIWAGRMSVVAFVFTLLPGIAKRFGLFHPAFKNMGMLAKELGLLMFLLAFFHYETLRLLPNTVAGTPFQINPRPSELLGTLALLLAFPMFITSNNYSRERLGIWWKRIHNLAYVVVWVVFLHVATQQIGFWTILLGVVAILEVASLIKNWLSPVQMPGKPEATLEGKPVPTLTVTGSEKEPIQTK